MNESLFEILDANPIYKNAYYDFLEIHKNNHGKDSTEEQLAEFEKYFARDFLAGLKVGNIDRFEIIKGERITIRKATLDDIDFMGMVERDEDNSPWVANWPTGWRIAKMGDLNFLQTVIEKEDGTPIGIMIFSDMADPREKLQLKRIAIIEKGSGYGKEALSLAKKFAFEMMGTKYFFLGTKEHNHRAQSIYKAMGFIPDIPDPCTSFHISDKDYKQEEISAFVVIREYTEDYKQHLIAFLEKCLPESERLLDINGRHKFYNDVKGYFRKFWCLFDGDEIIGAVGIRTIDKESCELKSLYVYEKYHGKKLGYRLMKTAIKNAEMLGFKRMYLDTYRKSEKAVSLYKKMGFTYTENYNNNPVSDVFMVKELDS